MREEGAKEWKDAVQQSWAREAAAFQALVEDVDGATEAFDADAWWKRWQQHLERVFQRAACVIQTAGFRLQKAGRPQRYKGDAPKFRKIQHHARKVYGDEEIFQIRRMRKLGERLREWERQMARGVPEQQLSNLRSKIVGSSFYYPGIRAVDVAERLRALQEHDKQRRLQSWKQKYAGLNAFKWMKDYKMAMHKNVVDDEVPEGEDEATVTQTSYEVLVGLRQFWERIWDRTEITDDQLEALQRTWGPALQQKDLPLPDGETWLRYMYKQRGKSAGVDGWRAEELVVTFGSLELAGYSSCFLGSTRGSSTRLGVYSSSAHCQAQQGGGFGLSYECSQTGVHHDGVVSGLGVGNHDVSRRQGVATRCFTSRASGRKGQ